MSNLIQSTFNSTNITQRSEDGYLNATAMCQANGKLLGHYLENQTTRDFLEALSGSIGIPIDFLVKKIATGANEKRGTWIHPQAAINLAQWCSPEFAVFVSQLVFSWMTGSIASNPQKVVSDRLALLEADIRAGLSLVEEGKAKVWQAVAQIQAENLWKLAGFESFEAYCKARWGWERSNAFEIAAAGRVAAQLKQIGIPEANLPNAIRQIRPLMKLDTENLAEVWQEVLGVSDGAPSTKVVKTVVEQRKSPAEPIPEPLSTELLELKASIDDCHTWLHRAAMMVGRQNIDGARRWLTTAALRLSRYAED